MRKNYQDSARLVPSIAVLVTKLGAVAKCDWFFELLYTVPRGAFVRVNPFLPTSDVQILLCLREALGQERVKVLPMFLEVSSLVLYNSLRGHLMKGIRQWSKLPLTIGTSFKLKLNNEICKTSVFWSWEMDSNLNRELITTKTLIGNLNCSTSTRTRKKHSAWKTSACIWFQSNYLFTQRPDDGEKYRLFSSAFSLEIMEEWSKDVLGGLEIEERR